MVSGERGPIFQVEIPPGVDAGSLAIWWLEVARDDIEATIPKVVEYSAHDLELTGDLFQFLLGEHPPVRRAEMVCWFYLASKVMRAIGALKDGVAPSDDTIRDIRVYDMMIARIRQAGGWPGFKEGEQ